MSREWAVRGAPAESNANPRRLGSLGESLLWAGPWLGGGTCPWAVPWLSGRGFDSVVEISALGGAAAWGRGSTSETRLGLGAVHASALRLAFFLICTRCIPRSTERQVRICCGVDWSLGRPMTLQPSQSFSFATPNWEWKRDTASQA